MAKAIWDSKRQAIFKKVAGKTPEDFAKDLEREYFLEAIQEGRYTREAALRDVQAGKIRPELAQELFNPAPTEPKPQQPKRLGPQERLLLPIMRSLWPPDGIPPENLSPGEIDRQVGKDYDDLYKPHKAKRTTILRIVALNKQGRYR